MTTSVATNTNLLSLGKLPISGKQSPGSLLSQLAGKNVFSFNKQLNAFNKEFDATAKNFEIAPKKLFTSILTGVDKNLDQSRQMAMAIFLKKMKSEFGIKPDQILKAFSKLSLHDLSRPPKETEDQFISQFKLSHKDALKARTLYSKLLGILSTVDVMQTRVTDMDRKLANPASRTPAEILAAPAMTAASLAPTSIASTTAAKTALIAKSAAVPLHALSTPLLKPNSAATPTEADSQKTQASLGQVAQQPIAQKSATAASVTQMPAAPQAAVVPAAYSNAKSFEPEAKIASEPKVESAVTQPEVSTNAATVTPVAVTPLAATAAGAATTVVGTTVAAATAAKIAKFTPFDRSSTKGDHTGHSDVDGNSQNQSHLAAATGIQSAPPASVSNTKASSAPIASPTDIKNNVQELALGAQFLAHKGGGEMNVKLSPEGLGSVHVKVNMNNGRLSVEMLAANDGAKQVIEKGLNDLKVALATHRLRVDTIRVDTLKDMAQQFLNQHQHEMERGFQQQFLNNFTEQNGSDRQSMFDFTEPSIPTSQTQGRASNSRYSVASTGIKSNRRLDLVA